uniref:L-rhamnose/proton symporter RhaT n=1 Tax=Salmonella enterica TaxID=28901 RepID=UPI00398C3135
LEVAVCMRTFVLSAVGGLMGYLRFLFYAWVHEVMPWEYDYMGWMLHMGFYVLCGWLVGLVLKEWKNAGLRPVAVLSLGGVVVIIVATLFGLVVSSLSRVVR